MQKVSNCEGDALATQDNDEVLSEGGAELARGRGVDGLRDVEPHNFSPKRTRQLGDCELRLWLLPVCRCRRRRCQRQVCVQTPQTALRHRSGRADPTAAARP